MIFSSKGVMMMNQKKGTVIPIRTGYNAEREAEANIIGRRIAEARKRRGMSIAAFSAYLENFGVHIKTAGAGKWETGGSAPNSYQLLAICAALDIDDLRFFTQSYEPELNDEGLRLLAQLKHDLICSGNYRPVPKTARIRLVDMPVAVMPAAAGTGNVLDDSEYYEDVSFPEDQVKPGADVGIRVSGDSMEPVYHDGQVVWVNKCEELHPGEVGIFLYDDRAYIKIYDEQEPGEEFLEEFTDSYGTVHLQPVLLSYNSENYDPIVVKPYNQFRIFGRVLK
jgi:phage repressor protein C with HTH and peptisase S24 domain